MNKEFKPFISAEQNLKEFTLKALLILIIARRKYNDNQKSRIDNRGVLLASGLIAGEARDKMFILFL